VRHHARRARLGNPLSTTLVAGVAVTALVATAAPAPAAPGAAPAAGRTAAKAAPLAEARAGKAGDWVAGRLTDGLLVSDGWSQFGPTLDVWFALDALGSQPAVRDQILDAVEAEHESYVGSGSESYAGPTGKLLAAVQASGRDAGAYAGGTLPGRLAERVHTGDDTERGRALDESEWGDYSNTLGQAWVVRALATSGHDLVEPTTSFLLQQQCAAGFFRESMDSSDHTCDTGRGEGLSDPSADATILAVRALRAAREAGVPGLGGPIQAALGWLRAQQNANGSFTGNGTPNANTTGLAADLFAATKWAGTAGTAAEWLRKRQVTAKKARGNGLAGEVGAIAYDAQALRTAKSDGIGDDGAVFLQWALATAQAAPGLRALLAAEKLPVAAPKRAGKGERVTVRARLEPGERFVVRRGATQVAAGWAGGKGRAAAQVRLPQRAKDVSVHVVGSRASRSGSTVVRVR
jgi:hypothetical protein